VQNSQAAVTEVVAMGNNPGTGEPSGNSLLSTGAGEPGANDWLPEKFRVMGEDGKLSIESSARKLAENYTHLEKRMGSGGTAENG
jgi:hypothetical protein